jgi:hypothetical protein
MLVSRLTYFLLLSFITQIAFANDTSQYDFAEAFKNGKTGLSFRLRHENAKQESLKTGKATTLRSRVSYETAQFSQARINLEVIDVSNFFGQRYNPDVDGLRKPEFTRIHDPKGTGLTQGSLSYHGLEATDITLGRQYLSFDNERFVGKDDFRQFPQSFDALSVKNSMLQDLDFNYSFVSHVNTSNANGRTDEGRRKLRTHLVNLKWSGFNYGILGFYTYFNKDYALQQNSQVTVGARAISDSQFQEILGADYTLEMARQQSRFNNPTKYTAYYWLGELNKNIDIINVKVGYERLAGHDTDTGKAFRTPLASKHNFHGAAEIFPNTPDRGLQDYYLGISGANGEVNIGATYHYFRYASGKDAVRAGQELDLTASMNLSEQIIISTTYAKYNPKNSAAPQTRRFWVVLTGNFL